jgi:hypothetical protein
MDIPQPSGPGGAGGIGTNENGEAGKSTFGTLPGSIVADSGKGAPAVSPAPGSFPDGGNGISGDISPSGGGAAALENTGQPGNGRENTGFPFTGTAEGISATGYGHGGGGGPGTSGFGLFASLRGGNGGNGAPGIVRIAVL